MTSLTNLIALVGRFLLAVIFAGAGINKLGAIGGTVANMASHGIPAPDLLVWGAVALEIGGGLLLMSGLFARCAALALGAYTLALALLFHAYWLAPPPKRAVSTRNFSSTSRLSAACSMSWRSAPALSASMRWRRGVASPCPGCDAAPLARSRAASTHYGGASLIRDLNERSSM